MSDYRKRLHESYDRLNKSDRIRLGQQMKDLVIHVEYEEEIYTKPLSVFYDYEYTNCFTFNAIWGDHSETVKDAVLFNPVSGKSSELVMCLNMDVNNYSNLTLAVRTRLVIHANDIVPNPTYDGASLETGIYYNYGVKKVTSYLLESPYQTKCRNYSEEKEERTGARMSQKNCLMECFKTETEKTCGCTYDRLSLMYDAAACTHPSQRSCLHRAEDTVYKKCSPQCPMACMKIEFEYVATDTEPLRKEASLYKRMEIEKYFKSDEDMRKNMACFKVHYGSTETTTLTHRPKYESIEVFSLIGGYSGLWLGFSLLSGYIYFLSRVQAYKHTTEIKNRKTQENMTEMKRRNRIYNKRRLYY